MSNVALVVLDTLRKDMFDDYFEWLPGIRYENAWSTSGWTVPAHGTLFTGRYPSESGVFAKQETLNYEKPVLAEALSSEGYTTRGFSANANICDAFEFTRGFDEFHHSWRGKRRDENIFDWGGFISRTRDKGWTRFPLAIQEAILSDTDTLKSLKLGIQLKARDLGITSIAGQDDGAEKALEIIKKTSFGTNEFLFLNLMEAHAPYNAPREYQTTQIKAHPSFEDTMLDGPEENPEDIKQAYRDCCKYLSDIYKEIFETLTDDFEYIITVSDHGEMFGRDGIWDHNWGVYPELTNVPVTIYSGEDDKTEIGDTVSLLDIYPTILSMAGKDSEAPGRDIRTPVNSGQYLVERHGLRTTRLRDLTNKNYDDEIIEKYDASCYGVACGDGTYGWQGRTEFMSRPAGDKEELQNRIEKMRSKLEPVKTEQDSDQELPQDIEDQLRKLGYM